MRRFPKWLRRVYPAFSGTVDETYDGEKAGFH